MSGTHRSTSRSEGSARSKGSHRATPKPSRQPYKWLGVSAVTLGLGRRYGQRIGDRQRQERQLGLIVEFPIGRQQQSQ